MHGELYGDVHEGITGKTSEILEAEKTADHTCSTTTSHDNQTEVLDQDFLKGLPYFEQSMLERLSRKQHDEDSAQKDREYSRSSHAKIQKVLPILLQNQNIKKHLEPREIAVGPIHANNDNLFKKELKTKLVEKFIEKCGKVGVVALFKAIRTKIRDSMTCFDERYLFQERYFRDTSFLFMDGCAVLQFRHSYVANELEEVGISSTQAEFIQQDLFLVENQIPFKVLTLLMDAMDMDTAGMEATKRPSYHLKVSIFGSIKDAEVDEDEKDDGNFVLNVFDQPKKCLSSLANCFDETWPCFTDGHNEDLSLRSVQELKSSVITILKISNNPRCLKAIDFSTYCFGIFGHLKLPALNVNDSTMRKLLNMVAYGNMPKL